jgi:glycosyltransferase involved in cell wall biosynthesis
MSRPLVSILIPCFNAAPWLGATLESALAQTWENKEIILLDDGSTDGSLALAQTFAARGVRILSQPKAGASAARNHALREARGDFLQFLNADDLLSPDKIAAQLAWLAKRSPDSVVSCAWGRFNLDPADTRVVVDNAVFRDFTGLDFLVLAGETGAAMHPSTWLVPRAVAERAGAWDETLSLNDDGEYFSRVALASAGIVFCSDPAARSYYRTGLLGSRSRQRSDQARRSQFRSLELITSRMLAIEDSPRIRQACASYWRRYVHEFYPAPAALIRRAKAEVRRLGGTVGRPPMGRTPPALVRMLGWKMAWRLKYFLHR